MAKIQDEQILESAVEARGAERGPIVRNVLVVSLSLVVLVDLFFLFPALILR